MKEKTESPRTYKRKWTARGMKAFRYVSDHGLLGRGGVVVFWQGQVAGWMNELRDPNSWRPGCIAVSMASNAQWEAVGGNEDAGAISWLALVTPRSASCR